MTPAQRIARHYGGDWHGTYGAFPTPGHGKADRGTTVKDADGGRVVFNSFNGGDWRQLKEECERLGFIPEPGQAEPPPRGPERETGRYDYHHADGTVAYRTVRKERVGERKRFVAQRPDGRGGWINGLGDAQRVLYRLPDLLAAGPAELVYLVEGERKADKLASWGLTATAVAFGSKGWRRDYARALKDRHVVILPDNDEPGRDFAERARQDIITGGGKANTVSLPGLSEGQDIIDWQGSSEELRALVDAALNGPAEPVDDPIGEMVSVASLHGVEPEPQGWLIEEMLPAGAVTTMFGDGGVGKTLAAMQFGVAVATGGAVFGFKAEKSPVLGFFCEDIEKELHRRFHAICRSEGISETAVHDFLYQSRFGRESLLGNFDSTGRFVLSTLLQAIRARALSVGARLVILDNIMHLYGGNVNDPGEVTRFLAALNRLALDINGAVLLIGHIAKAAGSQFAGTMAWSNASRSRLFFGRPGDLDRVGKDSDDDAGIVDPDARIIARLKANYAPISTPITLRWFHGAFVKPDDVPGNMAGELVANAEASADNGLFLACLAERNKQRRAVSDKRSPSFAPTVFAKMPESKGIGKARLERAMDRLFRICAIERGELWKGEDRKPVFGLRATAGNGAGNTVRGTRETPPKPAENRAGNAGSTHTVSKDTAGAPLGEGAPAHHGQDDWHPWVSAPFADRSPRF